MDVSYANRIQHISHAEFYIEYSQNENLHRSGTEWQTSTLHPSGAAIDRAVLPGLLADIEWKKNYDSLPEEMCSVLPSPDAIAAVIAEIEGAAI